MREGPKCACGKTAGLWFTGDFWICPDCNPQNRTITELKAEVGRLKDYNNWNACATGDCPHCTTRECCEFQAKCMVGMDAEIERLRSLVRSYLDQHDLDRSGCNCPICTDARAAPVKPGE